MAVFFCGPVFHPSVHHSKAAYKNSGMGRFFEAGPKTGVASPVSQAVSAQRFLQVPQHQPAPCSSLKPTQPKDTPDSPEGQPAGSLQKPFSQLSVSGKSEKDKSLSQDIEALEHQLQVTYNPHLEAKEKFAQEYQKKKAQTKGGPPPPAMMKPNLFSGKNAYPAVEWDEFGPDSVPPGGKK